MSLNLDLKLKNAETKYDMKENGKGIKERKHHLIFSNLFLLAIIYLEKASIFRHMFLEKVNILHSAYKVYNLYINNINFII